MKQIGILSVQGSFIEHFFVVQKLSKKYKFKPVLVKTKEDLKNISGLIIPGGESTVIGKLLAQYGMDKEIISRAKSGMAIYGTCAGAILLANKVDDPYIKNLKLIDVSIARNAYGRQQDSFEIEIDFNKKKIPAVFIRAPRVLKVGKGVEVLSVYEGEPVLVRENNILVGTFHPELTDSLKVHEYFVSMQQ
jgi:5'-phosphate synthase pdxT subunit